MRLSNDVIRIIPYEPQMHAALVYSAYHSGDYEAFFGNGNMLTLQAASQIRNAYLVVNPRDAREIYGGIMLTEIKERHRNLVFHGMLIKQYQKKGFAKSSLIMMVDYIMNQMNYYKVICPIVGENEKAESVLVDVGFELECTLKNEDYHDGAFHDVKRYSIVKGTFNRRHKKKVETESSEKGKGTCTVEAEA